MGKEQELPLDPMALEAGQRAAMVSNGCGATLDVGGEHVFCTDPRLPDWVRLDDCSCQKDATAAITAYLAARRSSSDEAEVVAAKWMVVRNGELVLPLLNTEAEAKRYAFVHDEEVAPLYRAPSGVKAGVTEAMVEATLNARPFGGASVRHFLRNGAHLADFSIDETEREIVRAALTAALGVGDEGMGEAVREAVQAERNRCIGVASRMEGGDPATRLAIAEEIRCPDIETKRLALRKEAPDA